MELAFQSALFLGGGEFVDDIDGIGKADGVTGLAGGIAQGAGQMAFAQADGAQEDDVGPVADKVQPEEVLHGQAVDFLGPVPAELLQGFDHGEAGLLDAALDQALAAQFVLPLHQGLQVLLMIPVVLGGFLGQGGMMLLDEAQLEVVQMLVRRVRF